MKNQLPTPVETGYVLHQRIFNVSFVGFFADVEEVKYVGVFEGLLGKF
jgi:hypothetical protein